VAPRSNHDSLGVVQVIETLGMGGAERLAVQIAEERARAGDHSCLYILCDDIPQGVALSQAVTVRRLGINRASVRNPLKFLVTLFRGREALVNALDEDGIDIVQTHLPGANFWGLLLQLNGQASCIPTIHNNREFDYGDSDHPLRARFRRSAYRLMMKRCPAVVAVSRLVKDSMVEQLQLSDDEAETMVVVPNGVPLPEPMGSSERRGIRGRFACPDEVPMILAAGRHTTQKNFTTLIEAAALLRDRGIDFRLIIAGDGELRPHHIDLVNSLELEDVVALPGILTDLGKIIQAADLFVLPSLWEGLPLVLLEAMAAGCAVLGTRIPGIGEILRDGETGRIVAPGDVKALADAMDELVGAPEERRRLAAGARMLVESQYSFDRVGRDLGELYHRIVDQH